MAIPSNSTSSLSTIWQNIKNTTGRVKNDANALIGAASVTRMRTLQYLNLLADSLDILEAYALSPTAGLVAYARDQENDPALNLASEYGTMKTQLLATQSWITTNFPVDGSGNAAVFSFDVNDRYADINLTSGQLTAFQTQLTNLAATIA